VKRLLSPKVTSELDGFLGDNSLGDHVLGQRPIYKSEGALFWSRYRDWTDARLNPKKPIDCRYQKFESRLPNPYNKGHDWFPEAIEAIKADVTRFENIREWKIFWSSFNVFHNKFFF
jgi:hypothetical protein